MSTETPLGVVFARLAEAQPDRPALACGEDEGRTLIQSALAGPADLIVTDTELRIVLAPLSSPHRTRPRCALR